MPWTDNSAWDQWIRDDSASIGREPPDDPPTAPTALYRRRELLVARNVWDNPNDPVRRRLNTAGARRIGELSREGADLAREAVADRLALRLIRVPNADALGLVQQLEAQPTFQPRSAGLNHVLVAGPQRHGGDAPPAPTNQVNSIPASGAPDVTGIRIAVLDTGIVAPAPTWVVTPRQQDVEVVTGSPPTYLPGVGHGTLVAGVIATYGLGARLEVRKVLSSPGGVADELQIAKALLDLAGAGFHFVNASFSGFAAGNRAMIGFGAAVQRLQSTGTVIIAAVGNEGIERPSYMAAFPNVVGVASVEDSSGSLQLAPYSNRGNYVKLCGKGTDVQSTYVTGQAIVSGTSFAAPKATAAAAAILRGGAASARAAADQLINGADAARASVNKAGRYIGF